MYESIQGRSPFERASPFSPPSLPAYLHVPPVRSLMCESIGGGAAAHSGMLRSAHMLLGSAGPAIGAALEDRPGYDLHVVGHSLGAGVAALVVHLLGTSDQGGAARSGRGDDGGGGGDGSGSNSGSGNCSGSGSGSLSGHGSGSGCGSGGGSLSGSGCGCGSGSGSLSGNGSGSGSSSGCGSSSGSLSGSGNGSDCRCGCGSGGKTGGGSEDGNVGSGSYVSLARGRRVTGGLVSVPPVLTLGAALALSSNVRTLFMQVGLAGRSV
eukprot:363197-Chlamydomonas_euryale.AAC.13